MSNLHKGHRERLKNKYLSFGLDILNDHEVLELLLYYVIPYKDTNPLAHKLLNEFGTISAIMDAPLSRLLNFGLTEHQACYFKLLPEIFRVYEESKAGNRDKMFDMSTVCDFFKTKYIGRSEEALYLLLLDPKMKSIFCGVISKGDINSTDVPIRKIVEISLRYKAKYAVMAHNHPSGLALPSASDLATTKDVCQSLYRIGVTLLDHIIVADNDQLSLRQSQYNNDLFTPVI